MRRLAVTLALMLSMSGAASAEQVFSFDTTPGKLPKNVVPVHYAIELKPDIANLTLSGVEIVDIEVREPTARIVLNAVNTTFDAVSIDSDAQAAEVTQDAAAETATFSFPQPIAAGPHRLRIGFTSRINKFGSGLFFIDYPTDSGTKRMLSSKLEPSDARRIFPCWDEPAFKASIALDVTVPRAHLAVGNMPVVTEEMVEPDLKRVTFAPTPKMSTYLFVLTTGELERITADVDGVTIGVVATTGKAAKGQFALESAAKLLAWFNDYFGVKYPLPKLDLIAVPGGFGGAMENWGGITFFESRLLFDPATSADTARRPIFGIIAHEMAHQWFGDLVTMAWWDNLWLNEGFASWMGSKCTAHFNPQWEVWLRREFPRDPTRRVGIAKEAAMEGDARSTTHPIQQPVATEAEANSAFDDITYKKGQSFLRMLESFLGEDVFREGIRRYMAAHMYSNTTTADLWNALSEISGKPIAEIAAGWTEQPGFPIVRVKREQGGNVSLTQERFTVNFKNAPPLDWKIPLTYAVVGRTPMALLMAWKSDSIHDVPPDRALKLNVNGAGNYRVEYDKPSWKLLLGALKNLGVEDRVNLLSDTWALVQANRAPISLFFELVEKLPASTELAEREQIIHVLDFVNRLLSGSSEQEKFQRYARSLLRPTFDAVGWETEPNEQAAIGNLRASLITALGNLNDPKIVANCRERFKAFLANPESLAPDLRPAVFSVVGRYADEATWNELHQLGLKTTSIEEKQNYYDALAGAMDPKLVKKTLPIALTDELPTSRTVFLVSRVARESGQTDIAWDFARANMKALLAKTDALGANTYPPGLFTFFSDDSRAEELRTYAKNSLTAASAPEVAKALNEVQFRAEFKKRVTSQLSAWIDSKNSAERRSSPVPDH